METKNNNNQIARDEDKTGQCATVEMPEFWCQRALNNMVFSFWVFSPLMASRFTFCVVFTALLFPPASVRGWTINCTAIRANILVALQVCKGHVQTTT